MVVMASTLLEREGGRWRWVTMDGGGERWVVVSNANDSSLEFECWVTKGGTGQSASTSCLSEEGVVLSGRYCHCHIDNKNEATRGYNLLIAWVVCR